MYAWNSRESQYLPVFRPKMIGNPNSREEVRRQRRRDKTAGGGKQRQSDARRELVASTGSSFFKHADNGAVSGKLSSRAVELSHVDHLREKPASC